MTMLELALGKLKAAGCDPAPTGAGTYGSLCPVHQGKRKTLSIQAVEDGRVLLYCYHVDDSGRQTCTTEAIVAALGLRMENLDPRLADAPPRPFEDPAPGPMAGVPAVEAPIRLPQWPDPPAAAALGGLAGEVVRLIEPESEADPVAVLLQLLVGFGNAIG